MSDLVHVRYLAPVHHVPPRGRIARLSYVPMVAPMRLRELDPADAPPGPQIPAAGGRKLRTRLVDGAVWRCVGTDYKGGRAGTGAIDPPRFRAWLEGRPETDGVDAGEVAHCLARTPLVARLPHYQGHARSKVGAPGHLGQVLLDGRERATAMAKAFVEGEIADVAGVIYTRLPGPIAYRDEPTGRMRVNRHPGAHNPAAGLRDTMPFRVDRGEAMAAFLNPDLPFGSVPTEWPAGTFDGLALDRDDDVVHFLASSLGRLLEELDTLTRDACPYPPERLARLRELQGYASLGMLAADELEPACDLVARCVGDLPQPRVGRFWQDVRRYARTVALPILGERRAATPEDAEALAAIAP